MFFEEYFKSIAKTRRLNRYFKYIKSGIGLPPDLHRYTPYFEPWHHNPDFQPFLEISKGLTVVPPERIWILVGALRNALTLNGAVCEFGVYKGGTSLVISKVINEAKIMKELWLYDSFEGMPNLATKNDWHDTSWFIDTSLEEMSQRVKNSEFLEVKFIKGIIPESFLIDSPKQICFAHIDLDLYSSVFQTLVEIYNRVPTGGILLVDDYGEPTCYGARIAVDEFFSTKSEVPIVLSTGQALIVKGK